MHYNQFITSIILADMRKRFYFTIVLFFGLVMIGCSARTAKPANGRTVEPSKQDFNLLNRDILSSYSSTFTIQFEGSTRWTYQLKTRKSPMLREFTLHIEGIDKKKNPGDVRLVSDGKTSWMVGPGTDQECVQFPNDAGMDLHLIYPETLLPPPELADLLKYAGEEVVAGVSSRHFAGNAPSAGGWRDVSVDVWQEKNSHWLLKFNLKASGDDQIFGAGNGKLSATYEAAGLGSDPIQPVLGCEIGVPLPDSAVKVVRFPGLASFETTDSIDDIRNFFQTRLTQENWVENEPPAQSNDATVLSYRRDFESVEIHIAPLPESGSKVKLIFTQVK
jgi:hypothetical protein